MADPISSALITASVSLHELFSGQLVNANTGMQIKGVLNIPEYQRAYCWSHQQVATLYQDLKNHFDKKDSTLHDYYLGSIILHQTRDSSLDQYSHEGGLGLLNIIDGKQRLTSIAILCTLAGVKPCLSLRFTAPESQRRIRNNLKQLRDIVIENEHCFNLEQINVTLVATASQDDAYRFFETQNSDGVRLSGIDITKAHHLKATSSTRLQDQYAREWEEMGNLESVVDCVMRGRLWQKLAWCDLASKLREPSSSRDQVINELAVNTKDVTEVDRDVAYRQICHVHTGDRFTSRSEDYYYDIRQPLQAGANTIHYLSQFHEILQRYCRPISNTAEEAGPWYPLYCALVLGSNASPYLNKLFDTALIIYISRFGGVKILEAGLWIYRAVFSLRLSREKVVRESGVQKFVRDDIPLLEWMTQSFTHQQLIDRLQDFDYVVNSENLEIVNGKKRRHVENVCRVFGINFDRHDETIFKQIIVERFDPELRVAIIKTVNSEGERLSEGN